MSQPLEVILAVRDLADAYRQHPRSFAKQQELLATTQPTLRAQLERLLREHFDDLELVALREAINSLDPHDPSEDD